MRALANLFLGVIEKKDELGRRREVVDAAEQTGRGRDERSTRIAQVGAHEFREGLVDGVVCRRADSQCL
jgi:hypothetical protein